MFDQLISDIDLAITKDALKRLKVDTNGLDNLDIEYLKIRRGEKTKKDKKLETKKNPQSIR